MFQQTEWVIPSGGFFSKTVECDALVQNGAFFMELDAANTLGQIEKGINPDIIGAISPSRKFALIYQGEIVAQGSRYDKVYQKSLMELKRASYSVEKVGEILEELLANVRYAEAYPVSGLKSLINASKAFEEFGEIGRKVVMQVDREVIYTLNNFTKNIIKEKTMISGMASVNGDKIEVFTANNFLSKEIAKGKGIELQNFIEEMHPTLKKRYNFHIAKIRAKNVLASESDIQRAAWAGSHGEIRALDKLLKKIDPLGLKGDMVFKNIVAYNRFLRQGAEVIQPPCVHCFYITKGVKFVGF